MSKWRQFPDDKPALNQRVIIQTPYSKEEVEAVYGRNHFVCDKFELYGKSVRPKRTMPGQPVRWKPLN